MRVGDKMSAKHKAIIILTLLIFSIFIHVSEANATQAALCAGSGGLLVGVGVGLGVETVFFSNINDIVCVQVLDI